MGLCKLVWVKYEDQNIQKSHKKQGILKIILVRRKLYTNWVFKYNKKFIL